MADSLQKKKGLFMVNGQLSQNFLGLIVRFTSCCYVNSIY